MRALPIASILALCVAACIAPLPPCSDDGECGVGPGLGDDSAGSSTPSSAGDGAATADASTGPAAPVCGNGELEGDEVCDDGDLVDGDGCNADCEPSLRRLALLTFGSMGERDIGSGIGVALDGSIVVVGTVRIQDVERASVVGLDADLAERFIDVELFEDALPGRALAVAVNDAGFAAVAGSIGAEGATNALLRFYDPEGTLEWSEIYDGVDALDDELRGVAYDAFGQLFAIGQTQTMTGEAAILLLEYTAAGFLIADSSTLPPPGVDLVARAVAYGTEEIFAFSGVQSSVDGQEILVGTILARDGTQDTVNAGDPMTGAEAHGVAIDGAGEIIAVGIQHGGERAWAGKYTAALETVWVKTFDDGTENELFAVAVAPDDSLYLVGDEKGGRFGNDVWVTHVSAEGDALASEVHDLDMGHDSARAAALEPDGTLLVTGETQVDGDFDIFVLRLAP